MTAKAQQCTVGDVTTTVRSLTIKQLTEFGEMVSGEGYEATIVDNYYDDPVLFDAILMATNTTMDDFENVAIEDLDPLYQTFKECNPFFLTTMEKRVKAAEEMETLLQSKSGENFGEILSTLLKKEPANSS